MKKDRVATALVLGGFSLACYNFGLGLVAQSVEQRIENPCVGGSIPPRATKNILDETPILTGWRCRF